MAQWLGQFSGNTHRTAVLDAEQLLRHAVDVMRTVDNDLRPQKVKTVRALAKRLLSARLHLLKARIKEAKQTQANTGKRLVSADLAKLEAERASLESAGVLGILAEFASQDFPPASD